MAGLRCLRSSYRILSLAGTSPRKFENTTSATATRSSKTLRPAGFAMSKLMLRLFRLNTSKNRLSSPRCSGTT